jgi:hypothetical protein
MPKPILDMEAVAEMNTARHALEAEIAGLAREFENAHDVKVAEIRIDRHYSIASGLNTSKILVAVELENPLSIRMLGTHIVDTAAMGKGDAD